MSDTDPRNTQEAYFASTRQPPPGDPEWMRKAARPQADADGAAIAALIMAFVIPPLGIVFGCVATSQARRKGLRPSGVASWGIGLGVIFTAVYVIVIIVAIVAASKDASYQACVANAVSSGLDPAVFCTAP